jgi:hypothetical protein
MKKSPRNADRGTSKRAPYRQPKLRPYGSIQAITLAQNVMSNVMDGGGGGGKTAV